MTTEEEIVEEEGRFAKAKRPESPRARRQLGNAYKWKFNATENKWIMPPLQRQFLEEWCLAWPRLDTMKDWAEENNVSPESLTRWKADERFVNEWKRVADKEHNNPEFYEPVINKLRATILKGQGDVMDKEQLAATKLFYQAIKEMSPGMERESVVVDDTLSELMEEELQGIANAEN